MSLPEKLVRGTVAAIGWFVRKKTSVHGEDDYEVEAPYPHD